MELWAHQPKMMFAMGKFNQVVRKGKSEDERLNGVAPVSRTPERFRRKTVARRFKCPEPDRRIQRSSSVRRSSSFG
jgi:hypothetical protein